jgi:hypothetical protein
VADTAGAADAEPAAAALPCNAPAETAGAADATGAAEAVLAVEDDRADDDIDVVARLALVVLVLVLANPPGRTLRVAPALAARRLGAPGARGSVFLGMGCGGVCG